MSAPILAITSGTAIAVNLVILGAVIVLVYLLDTKSPVRGKLASAIGMMVASLLWFSAARFFEVPFVLVPLDGGIQKEKAFLILSFFVIGAVRFAWFCWKQKGQHE